MSPSAAAFRFGSGERGITLIELFVTILVLAILLGLAAPTFRDVNLNNASTAQINDLVTALNMARAEATKLAVPVRVSSVGGNWQNGWQVATDRNRDGVLDANDLVLRTGDGAREGFTWQVQDTGGGGVTNVWFDAAGRLVGSAQPIMMTIRQPDGDVTKSRRLCVALSGRVESKKGEGACV